MVFHIKFEFFGKENINYEFSKTPKKQNNRKLNLEIKIWVGFLQTPL